MSAVYAVKPGDTLSKIAARQGTTLDALLRLNPQITNADIIHLGQLINLEEGDDDLSEDEDPPVAPAEAPEWYRVALLEEGVSEVRGDRHNPRVIEYHQSTSLRATEDEVPWCSSFANWCMEQAGLEGTDSAAARSWLNWGKEIATPQLGCVTVFSRPPNPSSGHVAFYVSETPTHIMVLGGNQSNMVRISGYKRSRLLSYRMPD